MAYPGTAQGFKVRAIISGTGKATDFKFGRYIHRVHPNKRPLKILGKRERGRIQGLPNVLKCPLLSQERIKLWTLNLACRFSRVHAYKSPLKILQKRERGRIHGLPKVLFKYPLLSQERVKLRTSNLAGRPTFTGSIRTKAH